MVFENMEKTQQLFSNNRKFLKLRRASKISDKSAGFLAEVAAEVLCDRLGAINREFDQTLDLLSHFDTLEDALMNHNSTREVKRCGGLSFKRDLSTQTYDLTENGLIPFETESLDLITSNFGLHWINNLPTLLAKIRTLLKPDGLFIAALPGDQTLSELRECLIAAESEMANHAALRIDPFGEVRQYGDLLQRSGFALPVVDSEKFTVRYSSLTRLISDLRAMGSTSSLAGTSSTMRRDVFKRTEQLYFDRYGESDGKFPATFEIVFLLGWAPHGSQQKPLRPGSAEFSLKDVL